MLASPAEDAAEILDRLGPEVWVEDKYDGIRAQLHKRGGDVRLYSRDLHDISGQFPEVVEAAATAGLGRHPRRRDPGLQGRPGAAVHQPPGTARAQVAVGGDPGRRSRSSTSRSTRSRSARRDERRAGRAAPARAAARRAATGSTRSTCRRRRGRPVHRARTSPWPTTPMASRPLRRRPGPAQRGPDGQGPDERLLAGSARLRLAEDEEGPGDDRLRRRRRRGRARQAPRRPVRLHVRRPRRRRPTAWSPSARPTAG